MKCLMLAVIAVSLLGRSAGAQVPDCLDITDLENPPPDCPDPAEMPWCSCLETLFSTTAPEGKPAITQGLIFSKGQPTASLYSVDVSAGTLDLSGVEVDDEVFRFLVDVEIGQPQHFILDMAGIVTATTDTEVFFDITLKEVNPVTLAVLDYCGGACSPTDEQHSFGKVYEGSLTSRGPDKGFVFEYTLYEPDPLSASPMRGIEEGDLESPNFTIPVVLTITDGKKVVYTNPRCGALDVLTTMVPIIQDPTWPFELQEKEFPESFDFGPCSASFRRGDVDGLGTVEITDAIFLLNFLFSGGPAPGCRDAADADDNGELQITDPILILGYLFLGTAPPPDPGPDACGPDVGADNLPACEYKC